MEFKDVQHKTNGQLKRISWLYIMTWSPLKWSSETKKLSRDILKKRTVHFLALRWTVDITTIFKPFMVALGGFSKCYAIENRFDRLDQTG